MFRGATLWTGVINGGMSQIADTRALTAGQLNMGQYAAHTASNVTGAVGTMAGIEYGAVFGSMIFPGVGTIAGAILGGVLGDRVGRYVGLQSGNFVLSVTVKKELQ